MSEVRRITCYVVVRLDHCKLFCKLLCSFGVVQISPQLCTFATYCCIHIVPMHCSVLYEFTCSVCDIADFDTISDMYRSVEGSANYCIR